MPTLQETAVNLNYFNSIILPPDEAEKPYQAEVAIAQQGSGGSGGVREWGSEGEILNAVHQMNFELIT